MIKDGTGGNARKRVRMDSLLALLVVAVVALLLNYWGNTGDNAAPPEQPAAPAQQAQAEPRASRSEIPETGPAVRFLMQNVENYFVEGERTRSRYVSTPKPVAARDAVAKGIAHLQPEIIGLVEMGGEVSLNDLRARLAKLGLEYPYQRVLMREGEDRALAVLSRHPIVQDRSTPDYPLYGVQNRKMLRGILDVVVKTPDGRLFRIIGAHLKSHVAEDAAAADNLRQREAITLSMYIQKIAREQPGIPTLVYGDWNDGPGTPAIRQLEQGVSKDAAVTRLNPKDKNGETWTIYYKTGNQYLTYDMVFVNQALNFRIKKGGKGKKAPCGVADTPARRASDHRAVWCDLF